MLLCVLLKPQPKLVQRYNVTPSEVATWSSSHETLALDLASDSCPGGGHAQQIFYDHNNFSINCEAPRLSRRAYVTLGITITSLALMMAGSPPDLCMLGATLVLILWPWPDTPGKGIITESEAWQGFSNKGVLTVGALFVVAKAVDETGIVSKVATKILGQPKSLFVAQLRLLLPVAVSSAFMNNTPIVAMMIPVILQWAPKLKRAPSTFLMPLSFASMLGGMCSMMGTSTNLVVAGLLAHKNPEIKPFGLFDIAVVGAPCCLIGIVYMALFSGCLLSEKGDGSSSDGNGGGSDGSGERKDEDEDEEVEVEVEVEDDHNYRAATGIADRNRMARSYVVHFVVPYTSVFKNGSSQITPCDLGLATCTTKKDGVFLEGVFLEGDGSFTGVGGSTFRCPTTSRVLHRPEIGTWDQTYLSSGDVLVVRVLPSTLSPLRVNLARSGLRLLSELPTTKTGMKQGRRRNQRFLVEAVISSMSPALGLERSVDELSDLFMERYGAALVSIRDEGLKEEETRARKRTGTRGHSRGSSLESTLIQGSSGSGGTGDNMLLLSGDVLLFEIYPRCLAVMETDFTLITAVPGSKPPRSGTCMDTIRMYVAGLVLTAMVLLSALNVVSLLTAALAAIAVLLLFKTITLQAAFRSINVRTLLAIVTTFGVGTAFETTGLAHNIATCLISVFGSLGSIGVLLAVATVTAVVGTAVSNNAVVILMYPICETLSKEIDGVSMKQLLVVLLVGASSSFLTPMSYQTNLMVMTPGKYTFLDYPKFGAGLQLTMLLCSVGFAYLAGSYYA